MSTDFARLFLTRPWIATAVLGGLLAAAGAGAAETSPTLSAQARAGATEVIFAVRPVGDDPHWYANFGYYAPDANRKAYKDGGKLCRLNLATGQTTILLDDPAGGVRDPQVHYDGQKILFSYRKGGTANYHLYEINADPSTPLRAGDSGLRQLTDGPWDDIEPCYLPDGGLAFVSSRCKRWVNCWLTQVAVLHRCDADGRNIRQLSANIEQDNTPWVLPDGRILFMRWEYVDRSQVHYHHLWTMNPDGTGQAVYFGNLHPGDVYLDAKPIPGTDRVVFINSKGHGDREHAGFVATVSQKRGPDELADLRTISRIGGYRDPWALTPQLFLVAHDRRLLAMDGFGQTEALFALPREFGDVWLHEPRPLAAHPRERVLPSQTQLTAATGRYLLDNVYQGRNMAGIRPGEIKQLLVLESLPKPVNYTGGMEPLSYAGTFTLERILGTVPVEPDGSACFEVPAMRAVFFVALDDRNLGVKRMQSFTSVAPGETLGCVGCHELRTMTPGAMARPPLAAARAPSPIQPVRGVPDVLDFPRDIQPILDRHCLSCHDVDRRAGGVLLSGDRGPLYSHSYYTLTVWGQLADGRNLPRSNYAPRTLGSGGSALLKKIDGGHHGVQVTPRERDTVRLWLDTGAPYPGTYAALGCGMIGGYQENLQVLELDQQWPETHAARAAFGRRCAACHTAEQRPLPRSLCDEAGLSFWNPSMDDPRLGRSRHIVFNLTRPEKSLYLLAPLAKAAGGYGSCRPGGVFNSTDDPDYRALLGMCAAGRQKLAEIKRFDMPGFRPRDSWVREMKRFGVLPAGFDPAKDAVDVYAVERAYWESLAYHPEKQ